MKNRWIPIIFLLLILSISLAGGFIVLWRSFIFLVTLILLGYLWSRLSARRLDYQVGETPDICCVGKHFEENFTITNNSIIPTPLIKIRGDTDLPGYNKEVILSLSPRDSHSWQTKVYCRHRGRYRTGALKVKTSDPLGLWPTEQNISSGQQIVVYPAIVDLPFFELSPGQMREMGANRWLANETGSNVSHVREYISGDSFRHIHWHTTAHTGNLMVREFDPDRIKSGCEEIWVILDMHYSSQLGEGEETTEEYSISIAASLAKKYLDVGNKVGLIAVGDRSIFLSPETGEEHLEHILYSLALIKATGEISIDSLLFSKADLFSAGSIVIIIMPSANPGIVMPMHKAINRHCKAIAVLLDSFSFGGVTSPENNLRHLGSTGFTVYVVRQGMEISQALVSRVHSSKIQYSRDRVP